MNRLPIYLSFLFILGSADVFGSSLGGGAVTAIFPHPSRPSVIYASSDGGGVFVSLNAGETWSALNVGRPNGDIVDIAIGSTRVDVVYAATENTLLRSIDGGANWLESECCFADIRSLELISDSLQMGSGNRLLSFDPDDLGDAYVFDLGSPVREIDSGMRRIYAATDAGLVLVNYQPLKIETLLSGRFTHVVVQRDPSGDTVYAVALSADGQTSTVFRKIGDRPWIELDDLSTRVVAMTLSGSARPRLHIATEDGDVFALGEQLPIWEPISATGSMITALAATSTGALYAGTSDSRVFRVIPGEFVPKAPPLSRLSDDVTRLPRLLAQSKEGRFVDDELASGFLIPVVANVEGAAGELFRSDLSLINAADSAQDVVVIWLGEGMQGSVRPSFRLTLPPSKPFTVGPAVVINDIAVELNVSGLGALAVFAVDSNENVSRSSSISGSARVWNTKPDSSGSVSETNAAVNFDVLRAETRVLIGNIQNDDFRTNLGIVNSDSVEQEYTVSVMGPARGEMYTVRVPPYSLLQRPVPGSYGQLTIVVTAVGPHDWFAYGASVNNASGDAWFTRGLAARPRP